MFVECVFSVTCIDFRVVPAEFLKLKHTGTTLSPLISILWYLTTVLDRVLVMRTPGGRATNLPSAIFAVDTFIGYKDIMVIQHTGMHPISHHLYYRTDDACA